MNTRAAEFIVQDPMGVRTVYPVTGDASIGRGLDNTIALPDVNASRHHALVYGGDEGFSVQDLGSRNGTFVNGDRVTTRLLEDGDVIRIGTHELHFSAPDDVLLIEDEEPSSVIRKSIDAQGYDFWEQALQAATVKQPQRLQRQLQALRAIADDIATILQLDELLNKILDHVFRTFPQADMGFVVLKDPRRQDRLVPRAIQTRDPGPTPRLAVSSTLIKQVMEQKQSILSSDAQTEFSGIQSVMDHNIQSMVCVPLICRAEALGVIHLHSTGRLGAFGEEELQLLTSIGNQAAVCVKNAQLYERVERETRMRRDFQRYVSPHVAQQIVDQKVEVELGGARTRGAVLFSDIVGFTALAESREPEKVVAQLNQYFGLMVDIIFRHGGTVDKFGGDAIMAVWGAPVEMEDAEFRAILTGVEMQNAVFRFNMHMRAQAEAAVGMGIGINTGCFLAGNIGSDERMEFTIVGDAVNLAARVESKATRGQVLISRSTYQPVADRVVAIELPATQVKGRAAPVSLYSIRGVAVPNAAGTDSTALSVPVQLSAEPGGGAEAMLTLADRTDAGWTLEVQSPEPMPETDRVVLQPRLVELPDLPPLECTLAESGPVLADEATDFYRAFLEVQHLDPQVEALLCPGQVLQSTLESLNGLRA